MTIEELYNLTAPFFFYANRFNLTDLVSNLNGSMTNLKALKTNPLNKQNILNVENQVIGMAPSIIQAMVATATSLQSEGYSNSFYDDLVGDEVQSLINQINRKFTSDPALLNTIEAFLFKFLQLNNFNNAILAVEHQGTVTFANLQRDFLTINFDNDALIDDLKGLTKASGEWDFIIMAFGRMVKENDTKAEVLSIVRGSFLLNLGIARLIIKAITDCSNMISEAFINALKVKEKILELKKITINISLEELDLLEKREQMQVKSLATKITVDLMTKYQTEREDNNYHEDEGFVKRAVEELIEFQSKGGKVEPNLKYLQDGEKDSVEKIRSLNSQVQTMREQIKVLSGGKTQSLIENILGDEQQSEAVDSDSKNSYPGNETTGKPDESGQTAGESI